MEPGHSAVAAHVRRAIRRLPNFKGQSEDAVEGLLGEQAKRTADFLEQYEEQVTKRTGELRDIMASLASEDPSLTTQFVHEAETDTDTDNETLGAVATLVGDARTELEQRTKELRAFSSTGKIGLDVASYVLTKGAEDELGRRVGRALDKARRAALEAHASLEDWTDTLEAVGALVEQVDVPMRSLEVIAEGMGL